MEPTNSHHRRSLRTRFTLSFAALGLLPLIVMGVVTLFVITFTHRQDVGTMELNLLHEKREQITQELNKIAGLFEIKLLANSEFLGDQSQQILLSKLMEENPFITELSLVGMNGEEGGKATSRLSRLQDMNLVPFRNLRRLPQFRNAVNGGTYFSPVYNTQSGPVITIAGPVFNSEQRQIMVLMGKINLSPLAHILSIANLGEQGYLYAIDHNGTIVAASDKSLVYKNAGISQWVHEAQIGIEHSGIEADDRRAGILSTDVIAASTQLRNLDLTLIAEWPYADAFSVVAGIRQYAILFLFATLGVVMMFGFSIRRQILVPLQTLGMGARKIGIGDFDSKISIATGDELEELGDLLNRVGNDLKRLEELKAAQIRAEALAESLHKEMELSRIKGEFITNTSHQLRTPLSIINWSVEALEANPSDAERTEMMTAIDAGLEQMNAIVKDLITVSEYGPGFKNTTWNSVNLSALMKKVAIGREKLFEKKHIVYTESHDDAASVVQGNETALLAVFENLFDNAVTYTPENGTIEARLVLEGGYAHFSIKDSGIGITESDQKSIFLQFFRATNSVAMKNVGTGLGLYICKNIIEGLGGRIWFESKEQSGTVIHFTVPIAHTESKNEGTPVIV